MTLIVIPDLHSIWNIESLTDFYRMSKDLFDMQKTACLSAVDLSRKGSIDAPILDLVAFINDQPNYFTTSSCSGRIIIVDNDVDGSIRKQGCKWVLTSHDVILVQELKDKLHTITGNAVFKFESFVMHVQCRTLEDAQMMLSTAVGAGYRNSGISVGNKGKFITGVRSTHSMEVPLSCNGQLLVSEQYLEFIVGIANNKMKDNFEKINRFFKSLKSTIEESSTQKHRKKTKEKNSQKNKLTKKVNASREETVSANKTDEVLDNTDLDRKAINLDISDSLEDLSQCAMLMCDLDT